MPSGEPPRAARRRSESGWPPIRHQPWGVAGVQAFLSSLEGNPSRSEGAAGVPSPAPSTAATFTGMSSTDSNERSTTNGVSEAPGEWPGPSTTWAFKRVKISSTPERPGKKVAGGGRWRRLARRNPRENLTITVSYRGGGEAWYQVSARGSRGNFPGYACIHDIMLEINEGQSHWHAHKGFEP